ncbi:anthranilate phosphoribosyltransferase family protein [Neosynechococcus sphagnicola]|uniref:anthranilate phosphoribosyltransferase family protein n=1 Tax=Neosynechococcus sphagnicola TaxID=1501145 RepID=UPI00068ED816|nr:anthranilate phosphoribosyltransferase family protein [Neosynechococcus sphagnicola]
MSLAFRELLRKIGSGTHTGQHLTREEAAAAARMMLLQEATPAQIGAFLIAHRIKRPTGEEMAGMLDSWELLGPRLAAIASDRPVVVLGSPYDGRSRTAPISPITALVLAASHCPVVMHGGRRMPTKEGEPLVDFWQGLGIDWTSLALNQVQQVLAQVGLGFVYLPQHFPLAEALVPYREQIGKRPPLATLELIWSPYAGETHLVCGFVHPPTEGIMREAFALRGTCRFTTVKGLEGSCDLPRERTAICGLSQPAPSPDLEPRFQRLNLAPRSFGFEGKNVPLETFAGVVAMMESTLQGQPSEYFRSTLWNSGFYLWCCGSCADISSGIALAETLLTQGKVWQKLQELRQAMALMGQGPVLDTTPGTPAAE